MLNDQWINGLVRKVKESKTEPWLHNMRRYTQVYSTSILDGCMTVCNEPRSSTRMWSDCYICYLFLMITRTMCLLMRLSTRQLNENELETNSIQNEKRIDKWGTTKKISYLLPTAARSSSISCPCRCLPLANAPGQRSRSFFGLLWYLRGCHLQRRWQRTEL